MKKFFISILIALLALILVSTPVLAWGCGDEEVYVELSDIELEGLPLVGNMVTVSGTVNITSSAKASGLVSYAEAESEAGYSIFDPFGTAVSAGVQSEYDSDWGIFWFTAEADASQTYNWESTFCLEDTGRWTVNHWGSGEVFWWRFLFSTGGGSDSAFGSLSFIVYDDSINLAGKFQVVLRYGLYCSQVIYDKDSDPDSFHLHNDILGEPVSQEVGGFYKLEIPEGTKITSGGYRAHSLVLFITDEGVDSIGDLELNREAILYRASNGGWSEVLRFTKIVDGVVS